VGTANSKVKRLRTEHYLTGDMELPEEVLFGIHSARAMDNFKTSGVPIGHYRNLIRALGLVKKAAVRVNATKVARYAQKNNCTVRKAVLDLSLMTEEEFEAELGNLISLARRPND